MQFNQSFLLGMNNRLYSQENGGNFNMLLNFWSGTEPTLAQFTSAKEAGTLGNDSNLPELMHQGRVLDWLDTLGTELYYYHSPNNSSLWTQVNSQTSEFDLSNDNDNFTYVNDGTASFFSLMQVYSNVTPANYRSSNHEVYWMAIGSLGLPGSGADLELSTLTINSDTPIIPSVLTFNHI